jgi:hypothetical protein
MDVDRFLERIADRRIGLPATQGFQRRPPETVDALFHLPLLVVAVMVIARQAPFETALLGRKVAALLVEHFTALQRSPHALETSLTLRRRCADVLAFLEAVGLVTISQDRRRTVSLSPAGKSHVDRAARDATDIGLLVRQLRIKEDRAKARVGGER